MKLFAFYSKRNGSYRGALSRGLGFGLNVNRIPWLLSREQNMGSKGRSQEPRLMAGPGSGGGWWWSGEGSVSALGFILKEFDDGRSTRACGIV